MPKGRAGRAIAAGTAINDVRYVEDRGGQDDARCSSVFARARCWTRSRWCSPRPGGDKPVALRCHCDAAVPAQLIGDELRIRQVLTNLGGNAIKFTHPARSMHIALLSQTDSDAELELAVRDTGIGIPQEVQVRLFDDYRCRRHHHAPVRGRGWAQHQSPAGDADGRRAEAEQRPGGSAVASGCASVATPASAGAPADTQRSDASAGRPLSGLRLLLVEDNELNPADRARVVVCPRRRGQRSLRMASKRCCILEQAADRRHRADGCPDAGDGWLCGDSLHPGSARADKAADHRHDGQRLG